MDEEGVNTVITPLQSILNNVLFCKLAAFILLIWVRL